MDKGGLVVRAAVLDDLDAITKLEYDSFPEDRVSRRSLRYFLRAPHRPVIAATIDNEVVGYALVSLRKGARAARIYSIAVDARFARRGVGFTLLQACERYARANGRAALSLEVRYDNAPAIALVREVGLSPFRRARRLLRGRRHGFAIREGSRSSASASRPQSAPPTRTQTSTRASDRGQEVALSGEAA